MNLARWVGAPPDATPTQRRNFLNVQVDAIGVGLASAAAPFLPVFLARLGATNSQVGLLTALPGFTGLFFSLVVGRFLQGRRRIVPWFSAARLMVISAYALTGLAPFLARSESTVQAVLWIWAVVTIPQTVVAVAFTVVMNAVAGPQGRYALMSRRWSILGATTAITVALAGQVLDRLRFPLNYQLVFMGLSVGGLISYYFSSHIDLPEAAPPPRAAAHLSLAHRLRGFAAQVWRERAFVRFNNTRFLYLLGQAVSAPLFPLYLVREVHATDSWIGLINTISTAIALVGYYLWTYLSKRRGSRFVLLATTLGLAVYPLVVALTQRVQVIALYSGLAGILQAGLSLVFFDELMKTVPEAYSATFVSVAQSSVHLSSVLGPMIGTLLSEHIGIGPALMASAFVRLVGFGLFAVQRPQATAEAAGGQ